MWIVSVRYLGTFREMLTPRRWIRGRDHTRIWIRACLRRVLCSQLRSLWILLMLLALICVAIQMLGGVHQARNDKLTELPHLRFNVENQNTLPTLENVWKILDDVSVGAIEQDVRWLNNERTADLKHQNGGHLKLSNDVLSRGVEKYINMLKSPQMMARKDSPRKQLLPRDTTTKKPGYLLSLEHPGSLGIHGIRKSLTTTRERNVNTLSTSISSTAHPNSVHKDTEAIGTCQPKSHIMFLKTHKTASSTILNILYRYGESRNLTFALPLNGQKQLFYPYLFTAHFVEGVASRRVREFHIMCNHMRFRKDEVAKVMPEDTFYFSILRHPVEMMESLFIYYKNIPAFHKVRSLDEFFDKGWQTYNSSLINNHYAHNILAFDFGFDNNVVADAADLEGRVSMAIAATERDFHLILISEYFDESMVLLKHALCWSLDDVVSFTLNRRTAKSRHPPLPSTADKIKRWNALDYRLYQHFNTTFWHKVDHLVGQEQMRREVSQLKELRSQLAKTCLKDGGAVDPSQVKVAALMPLQYGSAKIEGYNLNPGLDRQTKKKCQKLITPELQYTDILFTKQFSKHPAKHQQVARQRRRTEGRKNKKAPKNVLVSQTSIKKETNMSLEATGMVSTNDKEY